MTIDVSALSGQQPATAAGTTGSTAATANDRLDRQAFLELLVAQLRYQDPSKPMDSAQLMAQTSQLESVERLAELTESQQESFALEMRTSAAALVGQEVTHQDDTGTEVSGVVSSVSFALPVPVLRVGGDDVALDAVTAVGPTA